MSYSHKYLTMELVMYFFMNFPPPEEVINWIAQHQHVCNEAHLLDKWNEMAPYRSAEAWIRFYLEMDEEIREAMVNYITEIYPQKHWGYKGCSQSDKEKMALYKNQENLLKGK